GARACGDLGGRTALVEPDRLGLATAPEVRAANKIRRAGLFLDGRRLIVRSLPRVERMPAFGRTIPRRRLDALVLDAARARGARAVERARVLGFVADRTGIEVSYDRAGASRTVRAAVLVGADGSSS